MNNTVGEKCVRVGILLDNLTVCNWERQVLRSLLHSPNISIVVVALNKSATPTSERTPSPIGKAIAYLKFLSQAPCNPNHLFEQYVSEDRQYFGCTPDAFEMVDISREIAAIPSVPVLPSQSEYVDRILDEDVDAIMAHAPHVLLRFGFRILKGSILEAPEYGVWSYHHGDNREYRGGPACFWEMVDGSPVTGAVLQVLSEKLDAGLVLYRSLSSTSKHSLFHNRNQLYWKAATFVQRVLEAVAQHGWDEVRQEAERREAGSKTGEIRRTPSRSEVYAYLKLRKKRFAETPKRYLEEWNILIGQDELETNGFLSTPKELKKIPNPQGHFWADPVLYERNGRVWLFFEDYDYSTHKGVIGCAEVQSDGTLGAFSIVLERSYHLSGPFLFEWKDSLYMIPETCANSSVEAYRCISFPDEWEYHGSLLEGVNAVDPKIFEKDGKLWLFANVAEYGASTWDELCIFHATNLLGPWTPHAMNPVISDVRYARPAGPLLVKDGRLIRPSQDCSCEYGYALNFFEVTQLSEGSYEERLVDRFEPSMFSADGVHSYSVAGGHVVLDIKRTVPSDTPWAAARMLTYPFPPLIWRVKHLFHPLCKVEKIAVRLVKGIRKFIRALF